MGRITDEELTELRKKHPRGVKVFEVVPEDQVESAEPATLDDFVFRKIDRATHTKYRSLARRALAQGTGGDEPATLARELLVWPALDEFDALRDRAPAIVEDIGYRILADADAGLAVREGKR